MALQSVQLVPALQATFFREFLFLPEKKVTPAGQALTPQTTVEATQSPKKCNDQIGRVSSSDFLIKKWLLRLLHGRKQLFI
jgi:hypothetical protein